LNFRHRAPNQAHLVTLDDDHGLMDYAQSILNELRAAMVRVDADFSATPFKAKISNAEHRESFPPPHVGGYGSSSAVATWKPAR
jgi:threonyl-tRNA synthetase